MLNTDNTHNLHPTEQYSSNISINPASHQSNDEQTRSRGSLDAPHANNNHRHTEDEGQQYRLPPVVEIHTVNRNNESKVYKVEIIKEEIPKPYLGGYKHAKNNHVYHHAFAQTDQRRKEHCTKYHRETQTYDYSTKSTKVLREFGVQMERQGVWVDQREDKEVQSRKYFNSEMWDQRRDCAALYVQRLVRGWFARKRTNALKKAKFEKKEEQLRSEEEFRKTEEVKHKTEIERRMHPRKGDDFDILYDELEVWRVNETEKIKNNSICQL
jgi:hypothetical protein